MFYFVDVKTISPAGAVGFPNATVLRRWWICLLILTAAFAAYFPALPGTPIWDDDSLTTHNPLIKSPRFALEVFREWLYPGSLSVYYRPVQNLSYQFDYALWRGAPFGYHLGNILLHGAAAILLFECLSRLIPQLCRPDRRVFEKEARWPAFLIALVWTVHPVHNAAVAYISGRADSLAALFALGGWFLFLKTAGRAGAAGRAGVAAAWLCGLLALCSKEVAITWVVLFGVVHLGFLKPPVARAKIVAAIGLLLAAYWALRHLPDPRVAEAKMLPVPWHLRPPLMLGALGDYARLMLWPDNLHMCRSIIPELVYPQFKRWYGNPGGGFLLPLLGAATLVAFLLGARERGNGTSLRRVGALWFLIGFLPVSNLFLLNAQVAEHWIYMPSIGILLFLAGCAMDLPARWRRAGGACLGVAIAALTVRTAFRSADWTSPERLFWQTLEAGGYDSRVFVLYAGALAEKGRTAEAERWLQEIQKDDPRDPLLLLGLAQIYREEGREREMEAVLLQIGPERFGDFATANLNLSRLELKRKNPAGALAYLEKSLAPPRPALALIPYKARILEMSGRRTDGIALLEAYLRDRPWDLQARLMLADAVQKSGEPDRALELLRGGAWMDIWATKALEQGAKIELARNRPAEALAWAERGLRRRPTAALDAIKAEALAALQQGAMPSRAGEEKRGE